MAGMQLNDRNMPGGGPSFFKGAPLSKAITFSVIAMFVLAETMEWHDRRSLELDWDRVFGDDGLELWRLVSCRSTFETVGALVFGLVALCPQSRRFEREMGTRRFATFVAFVFVLSTVSEFLAAQLFPAVTRASGPYALSGGLFYLYHAYTPRLHPKFVGVLGFDLSEKAVQYGLLFQSLYASGGERREAVVVSSVLPTVCGAVGAFLCVTPALGLLERYELPGFVYRIGHRCGGPFVEGGNPTVHRPVPQHLFQNDNNNSHPAARRRRPPTDRNNDNRQRLVPDMRTGEAPEPMPQFPVTPPPSEETIESLTSMGFEREAVIRTLQQCDNNVEVAANRLLSA